MGDRQERAVRDLLAALEGDPDPHRVLALFADDASYHVSAWHEPVVGTEAIRAELERQAGIYTDFRSEITNIVSNDTIVFTERSDSFSIGDKRITLHWVGVCEIDAESKIVAMRDYYDVKELEAQLS